MRLPGNVSCFLKPDGLVLSMPAIHATGSDHFEAQLRYEEIQSFYRLKRNYWGKLSYMERCNIMRVYFAAGSLACPSASKTASSSSRFAFSN